MARMEVKSGIEFDFDRIRPVPAGGINARERGLRSLGGAVAILSA